MFVTGGVSLPIPCDHFIHISILLCDITVLLPLIAIDVEQFMSMLTLKLARKMRNTLKFMIAKSQVKGLLDKSRRIW